MVDGDWLKSNPSPTINYQLPFTIHHSRFLEASDLIGYCDGEKGSRSDPLLFVLLRKALPQLSTRQVERSWY
jgi:hypothetical protein